MTEMWKGDCMSKTDAVGMAGKTEIKMRIFGDEKSPKTQAKQTKKGLTAHNRYGKIFPH